MRTALVPIALALAGCGTEIVRVGVPATLTTPCEAPALGRADNAGLATLAIEQRYALRECTGRMALIEELYGDDSGDD